MRWIKDRWFIFRIWLIDKLSYDMGFMKNLDIVLEREEEDMFSVALHPRITGNYLYYRYHPLINKWRGRFDKTTVGIGELK